MATFHINFETETLGRAVSLSVILPTDKVYFEGMPRREEGKPYKTLYLLHGLGGNEMDWLYGTGISRLAEAHDLAVVMPAGENSMYLDQPWNMELYGEFIGKELVKFTRKTFPLSHKREDTYIGGLSMGGFGAMRNGLKYHDTFGAIISLSGAFVTDESLLVPNEHPRYPAESAAYRHSVFGPDFAAALKSDVNPAYLIETLAREGIDFPSIYMACGESDELEKNSAAIVRLLRSLDIEVVYETGPGGHEWDFWDTYIRRALEWLPLEGKNAGVSSGNMGL